MRLPFLTHQSKKKPLKHVKYMTCPRKKVLHKTLRSGTFRTLRLLPVERHTFVIPQEKGII